MTIRFVASQVCDGCGDTRGLSVRINEGVSKSSTELFGWREVKENTHLCPTCIDKAITKPNER